MRDLLSLSPADSSFWRVWYRNQKTALRSGSAIMELFTRGELDKYKNCVAPRRAVHGTLMRPPHGHKDDMPPEPGRRRTDQQPRGRNT